MRPDPRWLPRVCRMDEATCASIVRTPYARVLGVPNSVLGLGWYALAAAVAVWSLMGREVPYCWGMVALSGITVLLSLFLLWALRARLRVHCILCYVGHATNAALLGLLAFACA